jgi:hypothetical protein
VTVSRQNYATVNHLAYSLLVSAFMSMSDDGDDDDDDDNNNKR